jgi:hypothetical protein
MCQLANEAEVNAVTCGWVRDSGWVDVGVAPLWVWVTQYCTLRMRGGGRLKKMNKTRILQRDHTAKQHCTEESRGESAYACL